MVESQEQAADCRLLNAYRDPKTECHFLPCYFGAHYLFFLGNAKICVEIDVWVDAIIIAIICFGLKGSYRVGAIRLLVNGILIEGARSPSGKAKVCKTFIGGSIPPRASNFSSLRKNQYIYLIEFSTDAPVRQGLQKAHRQECLCYKGGAFLALWWCRQ
jgi:hypothetical protein